MSGLRIRVLIGDLSRTGVPIVLERLARWAGHGVGPDETSIGSIDVVAIRSGELERDLAAQVDSITVLEPTGRRTAADALAAAAATVGHPRPGLAIRNVAWRRRIRVLAEPDVVLMHGAAAWPLVATAPPSVPLALHLHELVVGMDRSIPRPDRGPLYRRAARIMAVSDEVAALAVADGAARDRLVVVPGVIDVPSFDPSAAPTPADLSGHRPLVAAMGAPGWRKGTDRFVALAHALSRSHPAVHCVWVGGAPTGPMASTVTSPDPVTWIPSDPDPWAALGRPDVLVIPSREDPLPLVALEAAQRRIPVVCADTGGLTELFAARRGHVVAGPDLRALHRAVADVLDDPASVRDGTGQAADVVHDRYTVDRVGPIWASVLAAAARSRGNSGTRR